MEVLMPKSLLSVNVSGNIPMPGSLRRTPRKHSPSRAHFSGHLPIDAPEVANPKQLVHTQLSAMRSPQDLTGDSHPIEVTEPRKTFVIAH